MLGDVVYDLLERREARWLDPRGHGRLPSGLDVLQVGLPQSRSPVLAAGDRQLRVDGLPQFVGSKCQPASASVNAARICASKSRCTIQCGSTSASTTACSRLATLMVKPSSVVSSVS